jgi:hypothetical protein
MPTTSIFDQTSLGRRYLERLRRLRATLLKFLFPDVSDTWLTILRVGLGVQIALFCSSIRRDWTHLLGQTGAAWINRDLVDALLTAQAPFVPRFSWLASIGAHFGLKEETVLLAAWICLLVTAGCLLVGFCCRSAAIVAWFLQLCSVSSGGLLTYGMDNFTTIGLFYLIVAPFPDRFCLDRKIWKSPMKDRHLHGFFRRVLQLHLCVIYFFAGLTKCLGSGWWNGENMWIALTRPPFNILPVNLIISWQWILPIAGIAVCLLEIGYPFLIWPKRTRLIWLLSVFAMHIGIGLTMGLYLFALIMIILNLAAFGSEYIFRESIEPHRGGLTTA